MMMKMNSLSRYFRFAAILFTAATLPIRLDFASRVQAADSSPAPAAAEQTTTPTLWDMAALSVPPKATWGKKEGLVQEVYYEGEPLHGKPTRVFAYYGRPATGNGPFPAVVLIHGGGGTAFPKWAEHWAQRGYAALAMDLSGNGPERKPLPDGGPKATDSEKFRDFSDAEAREMWTYHAVADVIRGHSLLASRKEVDPRRTAVTGISWGGYLTCIVAGVDHRYQAAVPVYGCGFIHEDSVWVQPNFSKMSKPLFERWVKYFEPSRYLPEVACPILFLDGTNDFAYPLDSWTRSWSAVKNAPVALCVRVNMPHGHIFTWAEVDAFIDSHLKSTPPLPRLSDTKAVGDIISTSYTSPSPVASAVFNYTLDKGPWKTRKWHSVKATHRGDRIEAVLPTGRPLTGYLAATDQRGLMVSSPLVDLIANPR